MRKEIVVPVKTLIDEAVAFYAVGKKVKIVDLEQEGDGEVIRKELHYVKGKLKLSAPFHVLPVEIWQNNRTHSLRRLVRDKFGKALHHLVVNGARFAD